LALGGVFLLSGASKALNPTIAISAVRAVLTQDPLIAWGIVAVVTLLELCLGVGLCARWRSSLLSGATVYLLTAFLVFQIALLLIAPSQACGCGLPSINTDPSVDRALSVGTSCLLLAVGLALHALRGHLSNVGPIPQTKE